MAVLVYANRVMETSTTTGTGTLTLAGAVTGFQSFAAVGNANTCEYLLEAVDANGVPTGDWERGIGTYTSSGTTLSRDTVIASSNGGSAVSFAAGTKRVWIPDPAPPPAEASITGAVTLTATALSNSLKSLKWHECTGTSADYTVGLPAVAGNAGKYLALQMGTAAGLTKFVTLDGNSSETINGALTRVMWANESVVLRCNGTEWKKHSGITIPMVCRMSLSARQDSVATATLTKANLDRTDVDNSGTMADATNKRINIKRDGVYDVACCIIFQQTGGTGGISANSTRCIVQPQKSGTGLYNSESYGISGGFPTPFGISPASFTAGQYADLYGFHQCGADQGFFGHATDAATFLALTEVPTW